jgi:Holliday junction resolvase-like predicted endonuclease
LSNTAAKGRANEHKSRDYLKEKLGCTSVIRAGASLGAFDLVGWNSERLYFVQVKTNGNASPGERETMRQTLVPINGYKFVHIWHDGAPGKAARLQIVPVDGEEAKLRASLEADEIRARRLERDIHLHDLAEAGFKHYPESEL